MEDFDAEIAAEKEKLADIKNQMDQLVERFACEAGALLKGWFPMQAKEEIKRAAEVTLAIEDGQLAALKAEVGQLSEQAVEIAHEYLTDKKLWWTGSSQQGTYDFRFMIHGNKMPEEIDRAIRFAGGRLGTILEKYGYLKGNASDVSSTVWRAWDKSGNRRIMNGPAACPYEITWTAEMRKIIEAYDTKRKGAESIVASIADIERRKKRSLAEDKWEST